MISIVHDGSRAARATGNAGSITAFAAGLRITVIAPCDIDAYNEPLFASFLSLGENCSHFSLIVDLRACGYVSCGALGLVVTQHVRRPGRVTILLGRRSRIHRIIKLCELTDVLRIAECGERGA